MIEFLFGFLAGYISGLFVGHVVTKMDRNIKDGRR